MEARGGRVDVLIISLGTTGGWRSAADELAAAFGRAGVKVLQASPTSLPTVRTFALTDLVQAGAARHATSTAIEQGHPRAIVYCSITAALRWPAPGAIWLDATASENRPGRHGIWQRPLERRRLQQAPLVMAMASRTLGPLAGLGVEPILVPVPVEVFDGVAGNPRDLDAITYAGDPEKKRLNLILDAWARARRDRETLIVAGTDELPRDRAGVQIVGRLPASEYRALLRRARAFIAAPRREDYGIAPLEALANGCQLVTTPAPGPYPALELARELDSRLVGEDLPRAIRTALDEPLENYATRAAVLLEPFTRSAIDETISERVLPRLLPGFASASV